MPSKIPECGLWLCLYAPCRCRVAVEAHSHSFSNLALQMEKVMSLTLSPLYPTGRNFRCPLHSSLIGP